MKICCFTGHRKLSHEQFEFADTELVKVIYGLIEEGYTHYISGFADGADLLAAEVVAKYKSSNDAITLEAAIPYADRLDCRTIRFRKLLTECDEIKIIQKNYHVSCFQKRNKYMVDKSDVIVAIWNGEERGGTYNTIVYARSKGKRIITINI